MGNVKCTRKDQGRPRINVLVGREGFSKVLPRQLDNQGSGLLNSLTLEQRFLFDPRKD